MGVPVNRKLAGNSVRILRKLREVWSISGVVSGVSEDIEVDGGIVFRNVGSYEIRKHIFDEEGEVSIVIRDYGGRTTGEIKHVVTLEQNTEYV